MTPTVVNELPGQTRFGFATPLPRLGVRAWRVTVKGFEEACIYAAGSRQQASAMAFVTLRRLGYAVRWGDIHCVRAPQYDNPKEAIP